ncbi:hypothetical protein CSV65_13850 [Sporosarcina sp. P31]|nr:hypothetical protein CSV66_14790 [Sporosarcina sp. P30]PID07855.1 hypothetical protein CSV65_13850 [Sporosarcina sp. P31]PID10834.1 hypothetical protein CSV64_14955 [Sporosarcina sp. P32b]
MIINIDGYYHQVLVSGKKCTKRQLREKYKKAKELTYDSRDFPAIFCTLHNFEEIFFDVKLEVDFVIDTDTDRIYSPTY